MALKTRKNSKRERSRKEREKELDKIKKEKSSSSVGFIDPCLWYKGIYK